MGTVWNIKLLKLQLEIFIAATLSKVGDGFY
jgi:hypothetical protein